MESDLELNQELTSPRSVVPRAVKTHPLVALLVAGALLGRRAGRHFAAHAVEAAPPAESEPAA